MVLLELLPLGIFGRSAAIADQLGLCILDESDKKEDTNIKSTGKRKTTCCKNGFKCTRGSFGFGEPL